MGRASSSTCSLRPLVSRTQRSIETINTHGHVFDLCFFPLSLSFSLLFLYLTLSLDPSLPPFMLYISRCDNKQPVDDQLPLPFHSSNFAFSNMGALYDYHHHHHHHHNHDHYHNHHYQQIIISLLLPIDISSHGWRKHLLFLFQVFHFLFAAIFMAGFFLPPPVLLLLLFIIFPFYLFLFSLAWLSSKSRLELKFATFRQPSYRWDWGWDLIILLTDYPVSCAINQPCRGGYYCCCCRCCCFLFVCLFWLICFRWIY